jgi:hypothetical protein
MAAQLPATVARMTFPAVKPALDECAAKRGKGLALVMLVSP